MKCTNCGRKPSRVSKSTYTCTCGARIVITGKGPKQIWVGKKPRIRFHATKAWCEKAAKIEEGHDISAGPEGIFWLLNSK